jgi:hypothetical protein
MPQRNSDPRDYSSVPLSGRCSTSQQEQRSRSPRKAILSRRSHLHAGEAGSTVPRRLLCMHMYALLDSFSALYYMLVPGCQPALYSKLSDCKGVVMTRRSPALYAMQCISSASSSSISYIAHSITAVAACPPFADDWTGSREGQMSWHNGSLKSRATSQTLRHMC